MFSPRRTTLRPRRHAVVVVAEFVKEDVEQLVGPQCVLGEVEDVTSFGRLDRDAETVENVPVPLDVRGIRDEWGEVPGLSANRHQARPVEPVAVGAGWCQ